MDRKAFITGGLAAIGAAIAGGAAAEGDCAKLLEDERRSEEFVAHWLDDLFAAIDAEVERPTRVRLLEACGRACYRRHTFKQEIAKAGAGSLEKLAAAYAASFESWLEGGVLHIRYGKVSKGCYCPAARTRPARPDDVHCECTKATHQAVCEAALGRPCRMEIVETVRRGGRTCHFAVTPA